MGGDACHNKRYYIAKGGVGGHPPSHVGSLASVTFVWGHRTVLGAVNMCDSSLLSALCGRTISGTARFVLGWIWLSFQGVTFSAPMLCHWPCEFVPEGRHLLTLS